MYKEIGIYIKIHDIIDIAKAWSMIRPCRAKYASDAIANVNNSAAEKCR